MLALRATILHPRAVRAWLTKASSVPAMVLSEWTAAALHVAGLLACWIVDSAVCWRCVLGLLVANTFGKS